MKKKMLFIFFMLLAIPVFTAIPVFAGKGQDRLDFKVVFQGLPEGAEVKTAGGNTIYRNGDFVILGDFFVQIGEDGAVEDITKDCLQYEANMNWQTHTKPDSFFNVIVTETLYIYTDSSQLTLRGTLEMKAIGTNKAGTGGTFVGFGTGEFEGAKIIGVSTGPTPVTSGLQLIREGTVMGWPTP